MAREKFSIVRVLIALATLAFLVALWAIPKVQHDRAFVALIRIRVPMCKAIDGLRERRPEGVDPKEWDRCVDLTSTVYNNTCFFPANVTAEDMERLRGDVEQKLNDQTKVGPETLIWLWDRLDQSGPTGRRIVRKERPLFAKYLERCVRPGGSD